MKVLVTGGSGFVGRALISTLVNRSHDVHVLSRSQKQLPRGVSGVRGDVTQRASLKPACQGMEAVIHLVGIISEAGNQTYEKVHVGGTRNMLEAAGDCGVRRFIHMSALSTRPNARARYHQTKWQAEELVRASALEWTIFRPSIIYGPEDGFINLFAANHQVVAHRPDHWIWRK